MKFIRNWLLLAACVMAAPVLAQAPLKMIIGFPPGATSDTLTRALAEGMRGHFDRPIVIENRPGGGGLAAAKLVKAAPGMRSSRRPAHR